MPDPTRTFRVTLDVTVSYPPEGDSELEAAHEGASTVDEAAKIELALLHSNPRCIHDLLECGKVTFVSATLEPA